MAANIYRFRVELAGWEGAPGVSTYFARWPAVPVLENVQAFADGLRAAYQTMSGLLLTGSTATISNEVDVLDDATGQLQTKASVTPPAAVGGAGSGTALSRATMIKVRFQTDAVVNGRVLRGGNYVGPIASAIIDDTGHIRSTAIATVVSAYQGLLDIAGGRLVIWHRPTPDAPASGTSGFVQTVSAWNKPAVLRSRRD